MPRPSDRPEGLDVDHNVAINLAPGLKLEAGQQYEWRLLIDGESDEDWVARFFVREQEPPTEVVTPP